MSLQMAVVAEIHPGGGFQPARFPGHQSKPRCLSELLLVAGVRKASSQVNSERGECGDSRRPWELRKGVDIWFGTSA
jgi:hypothetical protein